MGDPILIFMKNQFNFLRVKGGRTYFARVVLALDSGIEGVQALPTAGEQNSHISQQWIEAARRGSNKARRMHITMGGGKVGLTVTSVLGTEADTTSNTIEVASFCAAWKVLGHADTELSIEFDQEWRVSLKSSP